MRIKYYNAYIIEAELHNLIDSVNEANFWEWISKAKHILSKITNAEEAKYVLASMFEKLKSKSSITRQVILKHLLPIIITISVVTPHLVQDAAQLSHDNELVKLTQQILHNKKSAPEKQEQKINWNQYKKDADAYLKFFPGTPLTGELMARCAKRTYDRTGTFVPIEFALAQGQAESSLGTDMNHRNPKTNPFSVGEDDDRTTQFFKGIEHGTQAYYNLVAKNYLKNKSVDQLLQNFVNVNGERYASDRKYEQKMKKRVDHIRDYLIRFHQSQASQNDVAAL